MFYDVQQLSRIWNHPFILELAKQRRDEKEEENDEEGSLKDFICDDEDEDIIDSGNEDSDADSDIQVFKAPCPAIDFDYLFFCKEVDINGDAMVRKSITRSSTDDAAGSSSRSWWNHLMSETDQLDDIHFGNKMVLLMDILKECAMIGDKVKNQKNKVLETFSFDCVSGAGLQPVSPVPGPHRGVPRAY